MSLHHATCVAIEGNGVLIRGPSGAGKSALAVQLIDHGAELVADDQCEVWLQDGTLAARAPEALKGLLEVRGLGIVRMAHLEQAPVRLVVDLTSKTEVERMPPAREKDIEGQPCPAVEIDPTLPQAAAVLRMALTVVINPEVELTT